MSGQGLETWEGAARVARRIVQDSTFPLWQKHINPSSNSALKLERSLGSR
jgi:hypothetical protein